MMTSAIWPDAVSGRQPQMPDSRGDAENIAIIGQGEITGSYDFYDTNVPLGARRLIRDRDDPVFQLPECYVYWSVLY